ncbi:MAG: hypothetical protein GWN99_15095 [Gemmatimonadetes bacterium]|uniref:Bacterial transcriptional activator domain-containing protein n=1 Tax=Candidatus Kutchimonas denitrificans TaxID=3056748 RepID=A0AAE5CCS2_9BACT|nr:hypothetical protein [Gemmatimonadota bacterium]NIR76353.1 hypothetical protein [Candidatus Kutchimonas denitrificans]NIS02374.1 hypothetical protein [Gemmatimonadota bacterium]NIT68196.1 hypothetical protein [Gemmatimonadota bacterium]NIU54425.1 hypothetical protein [Gemmatimonadota bacterium]
MYSLRLLGVVALEGPSGPVTGRATQRRRLALLALLGSAAEDGWTRDKLIGLLWPEKGNEQARHLLSDSLYVLRRELGEDAISASGEVLRLDSGVVWTDVAAFETAIRKGELNEAVSLYHGPFLDGFNLGDGAEHWVDAKRSRLALLHAKALETLAQQAEDANDTTSAVEWWQKLAVQEPYDSRIALRLMQSHVAAGNHGAALEHARVHGLLMQEKLGADPAPEVLAYAAKLRQQQERVAAADAIGERSAEARSGEARTVLSSTVVATLPAVRSTLRKPALSVAALTLAVIAAAAVLWLNRGPTGPAVRARFTQLTFSGNVIWAEISPDGELLAYVEDGKPSRLLVRDLTGERAIEIASFVYALDLRWSPDGSSLLFGYADTTRGWVTEVYPRLGGVPRVLPIATHHHAWSPDGSQIAQWNQSWPRRINPIVLTTLATGDTSWVSTPDSIEFLLNGNWSPDGSSIALLSLEPSVAKAKLWTVALDGSVWHQLVTETGGLSPPRWSRRGDAVYYLHGNELRKLRVTPEGERQSDPQVLEVGLDANTRAGLSLSADGRKLAFIKRGSRSNLWSLPVEKPEAGARPTPVQLTRGTASKSAPSLSPDGKWIAFTQYRNEGDVFVIPAGGGPPRRVTSSGEVMSAPAWSPDGRTLAYVADHQGTGKVRTVAFEGGVEHTYKDTHAAGDLVWAPGARILYRRPGNRNFHLLDPATEAVKRLVPSDSVGWTFSARYSPTADRVALLWNRVPAGVWIVSLRDSSQSLLLRRTGSQAQPPIGWSADGGSVYVMDAGSRDILRVPLAGGDPTVVATLPFEASGSGQLSIRCTATEREAGLTLLCTVSERMSDAWTIENFDPDIR